MKKILAVILIAAILVFWTLNVSAQINTNEKSQLSELKDAMNFAARMILDRQAKIQAIVCTFDSAQKVLDSCGDINAVMPIFNRCNSSKKSYETEIDIYQFYLQKCVQEADSIKRSSGNIVKNLVYI